MTGRSTVVSEELNHEVSVQRLVESSGVTLRAKGKSLIGTCPFHARAKPTLTINPAANTWACPACKVTASGPMEWVMRAEGVSHRHAVELLRQDSFTPGNAVARAKRSTSTKLPGLLEPSADDTILLQQVVGYYHDCLKQSPEALAYLERRGLRHPDLIEHFKLGFCNRTLGYRIPHKNRAAGAAIRDTLTRLGILRDTGHELFRGSIVVPVFDEQGRVIQMHGRKVSGDLRPGTPEHLWLPDSAAGIVNAGCLTATEEIIVCKSPIDTMTLWCMGFRNVICPAAGNMEGVVAALEREGVKKVVLAFRRDDGGTRLAGEVADKLTGCGMEAWRVDFPSGMDANDFALSTPNPVEAFHAVVRGAVWMGKGKPRIAPEPPAVEPQAATTHHDPNGFGEPRDAPIPAQPRAVEQGRDGEIVLSYGDRTWRIRGMDRNGGIESMKVNVMVSRESGLHVDTLELYSARQRATFIKMAGEELGVEEKSIKSDLGRVLLHLEQRQDERARVALEENSKVPELSEEDRAAALGLLQDPKLLDRIANDLDRCGVVGERTNLLVAYLTAISRKLDEPLAVLFQSPSAAGKTSLMDAVLAFTPEEDRVSWSALTGQSLFYLGERDLQHKVIGIAEEQGAERASYALKLLQSEGVLTIASTSKDAGTGRLLTREYRVEGPVALMLTTTGIDVDEELANRCIVLCVDEGREQTRQIHNRQRLGQTLEGMLAKQNRDGIVKLHRNAQRLLRPIIVVNPHCENLTFADHRIRTRRDHQKYLTIIRAITLLHQHQRPIKTADHYGQHVEYIEVTPDDIEAANRLAHEALGRSLDELPPQTRNLLGSLHEVVQQDCQRLAVDRADYRFTRRSIRERLAWGNTQLRVHFARLIDMEYLIAHRDGAAVTYELCWDGNGTDGKPFVNGLHDSTTEAGGPLAGLNRPENGPETVGWRGSNSAESINEMSQIRVDGDDKLENARSRGTSSRSRSGRSG